ncbi:CAP domain-containing protein [Ectobacillus sp. sgz5001026]|uniref:CAP domain-containing protein n=1 Tax=Ectobacillus sp. sgz5001026 TaxID=3242473 RepID=UPI0036D3D4B6
MKKLLHILLLTVLIILISLYGKLILNEYILQGGTNTPKVSTKTKQKVEKTSANAISTLLGENSESLLAQFGEPDRIDPSAYDYQWWVYNKDLTHYVQFGVQNDKIVTIYSGGQNVNVAPFHFGQQYEEISKQFSFSNEVSVDKNNYQFELSEQEVQQQPLISLENGWAQLYFDNLTKELVGIRYLDADTLLKQRPYQLIYTGQLVKPAQVSDAQLQKIEQGNAKQILDTTNIIRMHHNLHLLNWDDQTSQVAYLHSKDMNDQNYFSHDSPKFGSLGDRLHQGNVTFHMAGENIASNYPDGVAAVQGWLNSEGHRKNLLDSQYTAIGIGVDNKYYTQNFILK